MNSLEDRLIALIAPVVTGLGYEFWGCELIGVTGSQILRVYIDSQQGVDVEDCATVSRQVSAVLDVDDPIIGEYVLEVSSPGMDRPLFYFEQFERYLGEKIKLRLKIPHAGRRNFTGLLKNIDAVYICLQVDNQDIVLECDKISRANLYPW